LVATAPMSVPIVAQEVHYIGDGEHSLTLYPRRAPNYTAKATCKQQIDRRQEGRQAIQQTVPVYHANLERILNPNSYQV